MYVSILVTMMHRKSIKLKYFVSGVLIALVYKSKTWAPRACNFHLLLRSSANTWALVLFIIDRVNANTGRILSILKGSYLPSHKVQQFLSTT